MALKKRGSISSTNFNCLFLSMVVLLLISRQIPVVHGRATLSAGEQKDGGETSLKHDLSDESQGSDAPRSLGFILASGPSRKGEGH